MSRRLSAYLIGGLAAGVLAALLLRALDVAGSPVFAVAAGVALGAVGGLLGTTRPEPPPGVDAAPEPVPQPPPYRDLVALEERLSWGSVDAQRFESRVRPVLAAVAAERLRQRHGVLVDEAPEAARTITGDELWTFLTGPPGTVPPTRRQLTDWVSRIERI